MRGSSPLIASRATLALNAGEWLRLGLLGIFAAPPWSCASEQYHLSGCPVSPGYFSPWCLCAFGWWEGRQAAHRVVVESELRQAWKVQGHAKHRQSLANCWKPVKPLIEIGRSLVVRKEEQIAIEPHEDASKLLGLVDEADADI